MVDAPGDLVAPPVTPRPRLGRGRRSTCSGRWKGSSSRARLLLPFQRPEQVERRPRPNRGRGVTGGATRSPGASTIPAHLRDRTALKKKDPFADLMG